MELNILIGLKEIPKQINNLKQKEFSCTNKNSLRCSVVRRNTIDKITEWYILKNNILMVYKISKDS